MESDISLSLCSDQALVKSKQCFVDFIHTLVSRSTKYSTMISDCIERERVNPALPGISASGQAAVPKPGQMPAP